MRVTFTLPRYSSHPIGGYLVVFRYANELTERGHQVCIVHARRPDQPQRMWGRLRRSLGLAAERRHLRDGRPTWFDLHPQVEVKLAPDLRESAIPDGDAIFATACTTAPAVASSPTRTGVKLYLVQGYEDWLCGSDAVVATWRMPLHKVVSSGWLEDIGVALGEEERTTHIPYGVEFDHFQMRTDPRLRNPFRVGMLSSPSPVKGTRFAIEALEQVQQKFPDLEAIAFGVSARPPELPSSIDYIENPGRPRLASLYNSLAVFLHSSEYEGWSLPSAEAMACGCALVATDSGGIRDYAKDSETALLVAPRDPEALAARLVDVLSDDALRLRLALAGSQAIKGFTWSRAADRMDALLVMIGPRRQA